MSGIGITIIICFGIIIFMHRRLKQFPKFSIDSAFKRNDYTYALEVMDGITASKFLSAYELDVYRLKAYFLLGDKERFVNHVHQMAMTDYKNSDKNIVFENWLYRFLLYTEKEFAEIFLQAIKECHDNNQIERCELAFDVIINHNVNVLETLQHKISQISKENTACGIFHFLCGVIYEQKNNIEEALHAFDIALFCFENEDMNVYINYCQKYIDTYGNIKILHFIHEEPKKEEEIDYREKYTLNYKKKKKS